MEISMAPVQDFTPCVQENRQNYPDPNSDFKWSEVESTVSANREGILACHEDDTRYSSKCKNS